MKPYKVLLALVILAGAWTFNRARSEENPTVEVVEVSEAMSHKLTEVAMVQLPEGYEQLLKSYEGRYTKGGWNHYGPGHFELDPSTGILTSHGGMGLFWYSVKEFGDFVLELDFMCSDVETNSGVFVRVPGVPTSNDYIFHSFELHLSLLRNPDLRRR